MASLRSELTVWMSSVPQHLQAPGLLDESERNIASLTINSYHLIHCLIFRDFLPADYQRESIGVSTPSVHRTWQAETTEACIQNANEIAIILQTAQTQPLCNIPPFIGYLNLTHNLTVDSVYSQLLLYIFMVGTGTFHRYLQYRRSF
jgi:hypothetical protein